MIYLDNNASTKINSSVCQLILKSLENDYANPSSLHDFGLENFIKINLAREKIAQSIDANPDEIIFTSGGTEGNNLCIRGFLGEAVQGVHVISTEIEHPSVLNTLNDLKNKGLQVTYLKVDEKGFVCSKDLEKSITDQTRLISIMHVNNEIGTIQNIKKLKEVAKNIVFHTDAVQSLGKIPFSVKELGIDLASFSGHKIHAPKGIGFIYKKRGTHLSPLITGGNQEYKFRSGTENVAFILGLSLAIHLFNEADKQHVKFLYNYLLNELKTFEGIRFNGPIEVDKRVVYNLNVAFRSLDSEQLVQYLNSHHIFLSSGSACSSKSMKISNVLKAINCPPEYMHGSIRIGLSKYTTLDEIKKFIQTLKMCVKDHSLLKMKAYGELHAH